MPREIYERKRSNPLAENTFGACGWIDPRQRRRVQDALEAFSRLAGPMNSPPACFADKYDPARHNDRMSNLRQIDLRRHGLFLFPVPLSLPPTPLYLLSKTCG
jgi:hypothetical protein